MLNYRGVAGYYQRNDENMMAVNKVFFLRYPAIVFAQRPWGCSSKQREVALQSFGAFSFKRPGWQPALLNFPMAGISCTIDTALGSRCHHTWVWNITAKITFLIGQMLYRIP